MTGGRIPLFHHNTMECALVEGALSCTRNLDQSKDAEKYGVSEETGYG